MDQADPDDPVGGLRFGRICVGGGGRDACGVSVNLPPNADHGGPYSGQVGVPIPFDGRASEDPDGTIVTYAWSFGDGGTGTGPTPTYAYASSGRFQVSLTVTDNGGAASTQETEAVIITLPPSVDPALAVAMAQAGPDDLVPVLAVFDAQVSSAQLYVMTNGLSRKERRRVVLNAKRSVTGVQGSVLAYLEGQGVKPFLSWKSSRLMVI